jgi:hypothetical protein
VTDRPSAGKPGPRWIPLGKCTPSATGKLCPSDSTIGIDDVCLKLISLAYCEMGRKDFPGSDLMIAREPQMCPPQVSQPQRLENAPQMISPSESDEKLGKRCAFPSSQLGWKGIFGFSLDGTSRLNTSSRSCALTLNKCTLAAGNCETLAED